MFMFDNETESKRPLNRFFGENSQISAEDKKVLQDTLFLQLQKESKTFLLTNPLVGGKKESEIEDLFSPDLLSIELGGKHFCRKDGYDTDKYFGKDIFSDYVLSHYKTVDFSGFSSLLNALNSIVVICQEK